METINDHTLLPVLADWSAPVKTALQWQTDIAPAVRGNESRGAFRSTPRPALSFTIDRGSVLENADLRARLLAGYDFTSGVPGANGRVGKFCVPWHGRASWIAGIVAAVVTIDPTPWAWAVGDSALAMTDDGRFAVATITAVAGYALTLSAPLPALPFAAFYPLFFGRISLDDCPVQTLIHGDVALEITGGSYAISQAIPACCPAEVIAEVFVVPSRASVSLGVAASKLVTNPLSRPATLTISDVSPPNPDLGFGNTADDDVRVTVGSSVHLLYGNSWDSHGAPATYSVVVNSGQSVLIELIDSLSGRTGCALNLLWTAL